jgi:2-phospho-L-lactate/phosphoenolpyruvate guanylyltransferase
MALHVLIPCKALAAGKSRLAPMLAAAERLSLCTTLLQRTLESALQVAPADRCHLVSTDAAAAQHAAARGMQTIAEPPGADLNGALCHARDALGVEAAELLVLPIDLPFASPRALRALIAIGGDVVAAPDRHGISTNILYLAGPAVAGFEFRFGGASLAAHRAAAEERRMRFRLREDPALAFDIDLPADLRDWRAAATSAPAPRPP